MKLLKELEPSGTIKKGGAMRTQNCAEFIHILDTDSEQEISSGEKSQRKIL
jgi:hypothetical protein